MKFPEDAAQINDLYEWAFRASKRQGLENDGHGKLGTGWDERQVWLRSRFGEIKGRYMARGAERVRVTSFEQLGFGIENWRQTADSAEGMAMFREAHVRSN